MRSSELRFLGQLYKVIKAQAMSILPHVLANPGGDEFNHISVAAVGLRCQTLEFNLSFCADLHSKEAADA